jgi:hypothetical protein
MLLAIGSTPIAKLLYNKPILLFISNQQTTARYDCRAEESKQRAAKLIRIPYPD